MDKPSFHKNFTGSIDDLLNYCQQLDADKVERLAEGKLEDEMLTPEEVRATIMEECHVDETEAEKIRMDMMVEYVREICKDLESRGFLEVSGYDDGGQPLYRTTELGKQALKWHKDE